MYTQEQIDTIFQQLAGLEVQLDENPLDYGPRRLNNKVAEARKMLSETEVLFLQVSKNIQRCKSAHRSAQTALDLAKKNLMANDPETRAGRNLATQDAIASIKLREEVEEVEKLTSALEDLDALLSVIKSKRADLRDIQGRIRDQIKLCQEEIGLGGRWGSKPPPGKVVPSLDMGVPEAEVTTLKDLQNLFSGNPEQESPDLPTSSESDSELDALLDQVEVPTEKPLQKKELDIDSILADFDM